MQEDSQQKYRCELCKDMTFIFVEDGVIPCKCRDVRMAENIIKNSGISEGFRKMTFKNFNYNLNNQTLHSFSMATKYVKEFQSLVPSRNSSILFCGKIGSGKTHLSMAIANKLMNRGVGTVIMSYNQDIIRLKQNRMDKEYYIKLIGRYKKARVLLIDDLFKGSISDSDKSIIFEILDYRYFNDKAVIISTEKTCNELLLIDEAIGSRIIEMCDGFIIENKGDRSNYRLYKNFLHNQNT